MVTHVETSGQKRKPRDSATLAEVIISLGFANREQIQELLTHANIAQQPFGRLKAEQRSFGRLLIEKGILSEATFIEVVRTHLGIASISPSQTPPDKSLLQKVSESFLRKHVAVPVVKQGNVLTLIMADPFDETALRAFERTFACAVEPAIASRDEVLDSITRCFLASETKSDNFARGARKDLIIGQTPLPSSTEDSASDVVDFIIANAVAEGASDIHIEPQEAHVRVRYRIDGVLVHRNDFAPSLASSLISRVKALCGFGHAERRRTQDGVIASRVMGKDVDLQVSVYATARSESVVIHILPSQPSLVELEALGFSPLNRKKYQALLDAPSGLILVTGPNGSGKSTTLYASLQYLNRLERKIVTVEDPVEYYIPGVVQGQLDTKLERPYVESLQAVTRQDPDVLMVGEVQNPEGAKALIQEALAGHKVFSTFQTEDTTSALLRLMHMGIEAFLISSLVSVVAQRLVRVLCPDCRQPTSPSPIVLNAFHIAAEEANSWTFYEAVGCPQCNGTGFKGRTAIHELLVMNDVVRDAILAHKPSSRIRLLAREHARLVSLREDGLYKATQGVTSLAEILRVAFHNESDALLPRSIADVVALCEGRASSAVRQLGDSTENRELYRTRFACASIATARERIAELFRVCGEVMIARSQPFDPRYRDDFATFVINTAQRLQVTQSAAFVDFVLSENGNKVKIAAIAVPSENERPLLPVS
jgi:type IV pilus assembly protein PilB